MTKYFVGLLAIALVVVAGSSIYGMYHHNGVSAATSITTCVAGQGEICPPAEWLRERLEADAQADALMQSPEMKKFQREIDAYNGRSNRLDQVMYQQAPGYRWDKQKQKWVQGIAQVTPKVPSPADAKR